MNEAVIASIRESSRILEEEASLQFEKDWEETVQKWIDFAWDKEEKSQKQTMPFFKRLFNVKHTKEEIEKTIREHVGEEHKEISRRFFMNGMYYVLLLQIERVREEREEKERLKLESTNKNDKEKYEST